MTKRIEQSRRHGRHDSRWTAPLHVVTEGALSLDAPEEPNWTPPTLTLVGGTDVTPSPEPTPLQRA